MNIPLNSINRILKCCNNKEIQKMLNIETGNIKQNRGVYKLFNVGVSHSSLTFLSKKSIILTDKIYSSSKNKNSAFSSNIFH